MADAPAFGWATPYVALFFLWLGMSAERLSRTFRDRDQNRKGDTHE